MCLRPSSMKAPLGPAASVLHHLQTSQSQQLNTKNSEAYTSQYCCMTWLHQTAMTRHTAVNGLVPQQSVPLPLAGCCGVV